MNAVATEQMTASEKQMLKTLVQDWLSKARRIDDRFAILSPAQSLIAISVLETCAEELSEALDQQPPKPEPELVVTRRFIV